MPLKTLDFEVCHQKNLDNLWIDDRMIPQSYFVTSETMVSYLLPTYALLTNLLSILTGYGLAPCADFIAGHIAHSPVKAHDPKKMLGYFYKSQMLKLTIFTILCLVVMQAAPAQAHLVIVGIIMQAVNKKLAFNHIGRHEPKSAYSN